MGKPAGASARRSTSRGRAESLRQSELTPSTPTLSPEPGWPDAPPRVGARPRVAREPEAPVDPDWREDAGEAAAPVTTTARVLVACRHTLERQALRLALALHGDFEVVAVARHGAEVIELTASLKPDIALILTDLPGMPAVEVAREIGAQGNGTRVLLVAGAADDDLLLSVVRAGAAGYLLRDADVSELLLALRTVHRGEPYLSPQIEERIVRRYASEAEGLARPPAAVLSAREREVLRLLAEGLGNLSIAQRLQISIKTVEAHHSHITRKLGFRGHARLVRYAIREGLVSLEDDLAPTEQLTR
jgi:DNA-binding NarL/FixJ family response regulator